MTDETNSDTLRDLAAEVEEMFAGQREPLDENLVLDLCETARETAAERDEARAERDQFAGILERCLEFHETRVEHWEQVPGQRASRNRDLAQTWVENIQGALANVDTDQEDS